MPAGPLPGRSQRASAAPRIGASKTILPKFAEEIEPERCAERYRQSSHDQAGNLHKPRDNRRKRPATLRDRRRVPSDWQRPELIFGIPNLLSNVSQTCCPAGSRAAALEIA